MQIIMRNDNRILIKSDYTSVNINDDNIVQYTGIYYRNVKNPPNMIEIKTLFIGIVLTDRYEDRFITGIYIKPLYMFYNDVWNKIADYIPPVNKYFLYPHLLLLGNIYYSYRPLYFLDSVEKTSLTQFEHITQTIMLEY
jgi:hypothetical protein